MAASHPTPTHPEEWRPVPGHEGMYEVSNFGRVRSLDRIVIEPPSDVRKNGRRIRRKGKVLTPRRYKSGHLHVSFGRGRPSRVHRVVYEAFVGPIPEGALVRHLNDDPTDNRVENLAVGSHSDNRHDAVRNGKHPMAIKTHCPQGHPYSPENTYYSEKAGRRCKICAKEAAKQSAARNPERTAANKRRYKQRQKEKLARLRNED